MASPLPATMFRAISRASMRSVPRSSLQVRGVANASGSRSSSASSGSSSQWTLTAAAALIGMSAGVYSIQSRTSPLQLEPRTKFTDRMKPREPKSFPAREREVVEPAEEVPEIIEVVVEDVEEAEEAEGGQQSAYNEETGEINWDCPCLGGMADGPCGEQFKAAFSCFIYSEAEPKGIDCVDKFKLMQDCFREHPDIYKDEIESDEAASEDFDAQEQAALSEKLEKDA